VDLSSDPPAAGWYFRAGWQEIGEVVGKELLREGFAHLELEEAE
jgi:hypothetical protein